MIRLASAHANFSRSTDLVGAEESALLDTAYAKALKLLSDNSTAHGIIACARGDKADGRNYASIFGRDAAICSLGMISSGASHLITAAASSLKTLARYQAKNGQIPKFVKPDLNEADFWYAGCIDATLWWLVAIKFFDAHVHGAQLQEELQANISKALYWLSCQEHPVLCLIQQNEASDWADIMPRSGFVLYSNALWYCVKKLYALDQLDETKKLFNALFLPFDKHRIENRRARVLAHYIKNKSKDRGAYISFVNLSNWGEDVDVFGNILSLLFGLSSHSRARAMVDTLVNMRVHEPYPVRVVARPISENDKLWREYMMRHLQNLPHQYHNGGIWPFVGGFWVMLLAHVGYVELAWQQLIKLAEVNRLGEWEFNEWLHGLNAQPMGMVGQSWNAALFVLAYQTLRGLSDKRSTSLRNE